MSGDVTFLPEEMRDLARDLASWAGEVDSTGDEVEEVLDQLRRSSSEFVPPLPDHRRSIEEAGQSLEAVGEDLGRLADEAEEVEREGCSLLARVPTVASGAIGALGQYQALERAGRATARGAQFVSNAKRLRAVDRRYGSRPMPDIATIRRELPGGNRLPRKRVRSTQLARYRELKRARAGFRLRIAEARQAFRNNLPLTRWGTRIRAFMTTTKTGTWIRYGGRALGVAGVGISIFEAWNGYKEGDTEKMVTNGLFAVGGALMLTPNPITAGVGAAIVAGVLIYENWDKVSGAAEWVGDGVSSVVGGAKKFLGSIF